MAGSFFKGADASQLLVAWDFERGLLVAFGSLRRARASLYFFLVPATGWKLSSAGWGSRPAGTRP